MNAAERAAFAERATLTDVVAIRDINELGMRVARALWRENGRGELNREAVELRAFDATTPGPRSLASWL